MKSAIILLLSSSLLVGCASSGEKTELYLNQEGQYVVPEAKKNKIFYGPSNIPGALDPANSMLPDRMRALENSLYPHSWK